MRFRHHVVWAVLVGTCLALPSAALSTPPTNDNRAAPLEVPAFPATIEGTTVEATVERLDPQDSECGRVEGTVWYRITQAPDGTIVLGVRGAALAPVLRVYTIRPNSIQELVCDSAARSREALVAFKTQRGASYLVLVGKRPGTADSAFTLKAQLYFPPANDVVGQARPLRVPGTAKGSTFGATGGDDDPYSCDLDGGTVWYRVVPGKAERVVVQFTASGELDASIAVVERVRSRTRTATCDDTDRRGRALVAFKVNKGAAYFLVVGEQESSPPGTFALRTLAAQPAEKAPGQRLPVGGARSSVNGLTDLNDVWWTTMSRGTTYRIALRSERCARVKLTGPVGSLGTLACNGYAPFTPGPDGGGRYVFEVIAPPGQGSATYRLQVARARVDDIGVGLELRNLRTARGALAPSALDVVDIYHFDVARRSDVRLRLQKPDRRDFSMELMTDTGRTLRTGMEEISRRLDRGRYIVVVGGKPGTAAGQYRLSLVIRQITKTTIALDDANAENEKNEIAPGSSVTLRVETTPTPERGWTQLQIDRFDPLTGWEFNRTLRVRATGATVVWKPPLPGRWRVRATFLGTLLSSPSTSPYVGLLVATPLPEEDASSLR